MSFVSGQRPSMLSMTFPCSKTFLRFLKCEQEGSDLLNVLEQNGRLFFRITDSSLIMEHDGQMNPHQILQVLQRKWHETAMKKAMKVSLLHHQCTTSKSVVLTIPQAAVIQFHRSQIIRENRIVDLLIDSGGIVSWFGQYDCVTNATQHILNLLQEYFHKEPFQSPPEAYTDPLSPTINPMNINNMMSDNLFSNIGGLSPYNLSALSNLQCQQLYTMCQEDLIKNLAGSLSTMSLFPSNSAAAGEPNMTHLMSHLPTDTGISERSSNPPRGSTSSRNEKRRFAERLYFMVPSTDAPRLIGTRGVNKKRIEEQTGCSITLHTESKKDGEFPVEINGISLAVCERAKNHIEKFLMSNGNSDEKKDRSRPKVHLEFSPKKSQPTNASTPKKEFGLDENANW